MLDGQFTLKRLSIMDRARLGVRKSQICGGMYCVRDDNGKATGQGVDDMTDFFAEMLAHLEVGLAQKPQWFDVEEISDMGLIQEVYTHAVEFENTFFRRKDGGDGPGKPGQVGKADGSPQSQGTNTGDNSPKVVGQEVSSALDA